MSFDTKGTIGKKPCEISLNAILAEQKNGKLSGNLLSLLQKFKKILLFLGTADSPYTKFLADLARQHSEKRLSDITGVKLKGVPITNKVASHALSCMRAYYREFLTSKRKFK